MLSGLLPCIAVAARPAFQTSEELLASILQAGGNVGATCLTGEGRVLFGQDAGRKQRRAAVLAILHCIIAKRDKKQKRRRSGPILGLISQTVREHGFWATVAHLDDVRFQRKFRLSRSAFRDLCVLLGPHLTREGGRGGARAGHAAPPLSVETKLSVALRFLAGASVEDLDRYGVERKSSIMGCCVWPVVGAIHACPELEFRLLRALKSAKAGDSRELKEIQAGFDKKSGGMLPGCIGALDGWLPAIHKPPVSSELPPPRNKVHHLAAQHYSDPA